MSRKRVLALVLAAGCLGAGGAGVVTAVGAPGHSAHGKGPLFGALKGANELFPNGHRGAGDLDGRGSASATYDEGKLCFGLTVKNIGNPVAAHIHRGTRDVNGPIVVPLTPPATGDPGASSGCVDVPAALAQEILDNPRRFYWNVHTMDFPGGAVRGQVFDKRK